MVFDVSIIGVLCSSVALVFMVYVWRKSVGNRDFFLEIFDDLLHEATTNEEMLKKLYLVGAIMGNGLKQGLDLPNLLPKSGKFRIEDLIGMGIQHFLMPKGDGGISPSGTPQQPQQQRKATPQM